MYMLCMYALCMYAYVTYVRIWLFGRRRRGISQCMMSDNGTNFVGARNELGKLLPFSNHREKVAQFLATVAQ